jgi:type IV pilus assembly protein PilV
MNNSKIVEKGGPGFAGVLEQGGFTLTEILVAAFILVVAVLGIAALLPTASNNIFVASEETKAAILAQDLMEQIRNAPSFNDMLSFADTPPAGATDPRPAYISNQRAAWSTKVANAAPNGEGLPGGSGAITITTTGASPHRRATITLTIDWRGRNCPPVSLVTQDSEDF